MAQITIYLDDATEAAAREAAAKANLPVSRWFAQFAEAERARQHQDWTSFWQGVDLLRAADYDGSTIEVSSSDLGVDVPRESF
jgi:hypothetical protein